jgi:hypothetical protein
MKSRSIGAAGALGLELPELVPAVALGVEEEVLVAVAVGAGVDFGLSAGAAAARAFVHPARPSLVPVEVELGAAGLAGAGRALGIAGAAGLGASGSPERLLAAASFVAADLLAAAEREPVLMIGTRASVRAASMAAAGVAAVAAGAGVAAGVVVLGGGGGGVLSNSSTTAGSSSS